MFKDANLMAVLYVISSILVCCIIGCRLDEFALRLEKALDFLSRDKTEIEKATGTLGSRLFCKHL